MIVAKVELRSIPHVVKSIRFMIRYGSVARFSFTAVRGSFRQRLRCGQIDNWYQIGIVALFSIVQTAL